MGLEFSLPHIFFKGDKRYTSLTIMWDFQQSFLLLLVSIFGVEIINASFATASVEQHNIETSLGDFLSAIDRMEFPAFPS